MGISHPFPAQVLGITRHADKAAIRKAYKRTSLRTHPDKGGDKAVFVAVTRAYTTLSNVRTRRDYDACYGCADNVDFDKALTLIKASPRPLTLRLVAPATS